MDDKVLSLTSDDSDEDFIPKEEDCNSGSEVSECESSEGENKTSKSHKRRKKTKGSTKKVKTSNDLEGEDDPKEAVETKIDVDALWADFKKDVNNSDSKKTASSLNKSTELENVNSSSSTEDDKKTSVNVKPKGVLNIGVKKKVGGLSSVLNHIGKKDKMSTLQKSKLDWNNFKKNEGIDEEIKMYNRGKDGYLEKQDFLQRTDLRQFEIEKGLRSARRKF